VALQKYLDSVFLWHGDHIYLAMGRREPMHAPPKLNCLGDGLAGVVVMGAVPDAIVLWYRRYLILLGKTSDLLPKFVCSI